MASAEEFRAWKLDRLAQHFQRPGMWTLGAMATSMGLRQALEDLMFLDDRAEEFHAVMKAFLARYDSGVRGAGGAVRVPHGRPEAQRR
jgi:hypothetical protein